MTLQSNAPVRRRRVLPLTIRVRRASSRRVMRDRGRQRPSPLVFGRQLRWYFPASFPTPESFRSSMCLINLTDAFSGVRARLDKKEDLNAGCFGKRRFAARSDMEEHGGED